MVEASQLERLLWGYQREVFSLEHKLQNGNGSPPRKRRQAVRLQQLRNELIPALLNRLNGSG